MIRTNHGPRSDGRCDQCAAVGPRWLVTEAAGPDDPLPRHRLLCRTHTGDDRSPTAPPVAVDPVRAVAGELVDLAARIDAYADGQNAVLNRFAELLAARVRGIDDRIDGVEVKVGTVAAALAADLRTFISRLDELEGRLAVGDAAERWLEAEAAP